MAERRMFSKVIIDSDAFLDMPLSTQALYFHLSMRADDEGFVGNPKKIQRMVGASDDDMKVLIMKRFILVFDSGIVVIKHWKIHNYIQNDRFKSTTYLEEKNQLMLDEKKSYTERIQNGYNPDTQISLDKDSIDKVSLDKISIEECVVQENSTAAPPTKQKRFVKPTLEEVEDYCKERNNNIDAQRFINYYESNGWKVGKNPMKDWKAAVRTWEGKNYDSDKKNTVNNQDKSGNVFLNIANKKGII